MINGIFHIDKKTRITDYSDTTLWNPKEFGVNLVESISPHSSNIDNFKFVLTGDCWENQELLREYRNKGLKIFMASREPIVVESSKHAFFYYEDMKRRHGDYYFCPDVVLAAGQKYADLWKDRTKCEITGYVRFEQYISLSKLSKEGLRKKYSLDGSKRVVFFPAFGPLLFSDTNGGEYIDATDELNEVIPALEEIAKDKDTCVVIKPHPYSHRYYSKVKKSSVKLKRSDDLLRKYWLRDRNGIMVLKQPRFDGSALKEMLYLADIVVACGVSTTILEALLLKKPTINFLPGRTNVGYNKYDVESSVPTVYNIQELVELAKGDVPILDSSDVITKYMGPVDGGFCKRVCEIIKSNVLLSDSIRMEK
ncbi:MAG: hypothetical protein WC523_00400 [Patescibacteria group bacterium]